MVFVVIAFYVLISSYDLTYLHQNDLKKDIYVYIFLISISVIISSLEASNVQIPDPMIYVAKFLKVILGGNYE